LFVVRLALIVTSDSVYRGLRADEVTPIVSSDGRFEVVFSRVVPNDVGEIMAAVLEASNLADVVLVTGGTGVSPRDVTVEALESIASKRVPGLGEEHRRRSYLRVGARALMSRSEGFVVGGALAFASPGNPDAVKVALDILAEVAEHCLEELRGRGHRGAHQG
jgi:molybdenum cofactor biosynthesis protein B